MFPVFVEELELERVGQPVGGDPWFGLRLEATDDQAAHLLLEVGVAVGVAQYGQVAVDPVDLLGDHIEVFGRVERYVDPGEQADGFGPLAGAVDHDVGLYPASICAYRGHPAGACLDGRDPG